GGTAILPSPTVLSTNTGNITLNQLSAAQNATNFNAIINAANANLALNNAAPGHRPSAEYGWGIQGGLKFNLPFIAPGDLLYLQAAYSEGALSYTGANGGIGYELNAGAYTNRFAVNT